MFVVLVLEFVESTVLLTLNALFWIWKCIISQERRVYFNSCKASPVTRRIDDWACTFTSCLIGLSFFTSGG